MSPKSKKVFQEALQLPPVEKAELIEQLFTSFQFSNWEEIDGLWAKESEDRIDAYDRGEIASVSAEEVFKNIDRK